MELTEKQKEGLAIAVERFNMGFPYTIIAGYAGTGKSTLIKFIIEALNIDLEDVVYLAYTGKAAEVLRRKGCPNACTAHKFLFYSSKTIQGNFIFKPRKSLESRPALVVVDEISMLPKELWELLLSHKIYVIACGDPFQIPPISKDSENGLLENPHIFLDEIMRQEEDSEIITLSMNIRKMNPIFFSKGKEVQIFPWENLIDGMYTWADQVIVGTNKKRAEVNAYVRNMLGKSGKPQVGDKLISLENHWDILDTTQESALVNGTIGYVKEIKEDSVVYNIRPGFRIGPIDVYRLTLENEIGEIFSDIIIDKKYIDTGVRTLSPKQEYHIYKNKIRLAETAPCLFDYGYAITGHRAQGSEWDKVLVIEEAFPFNKIEHARWLYTGVTRGSEKVVLVR